MAHAVSMIAEEMGTVLERGALSPNIRERRDASSALFDAEGRMIAQAAHIPVHLGAMPESVRAVIERESRARRRLPAQRPVSRRLAPARPDDGGGDRARWHTRRLCRGARAPRRRRRHEPRAACRGARRSWCRRASSCRRCASRAGTATKPTSCAGARQRAHAGRAPGRPPGAARGVRGGCATDGSRCCAGKASTGMRAAGDALLDYTERRARARIAQLGDVSRQGARRARRAMA